MDPASVLFHSDRPKSGQSMKTLIGGAQFQQQRLTILNNDFNMGPPSYFKSLHPCANLRFPSYNTPYSHSLIRLLINVSKAAIRVDGYSVHCFTVSTAGHRTTRAGYLGQCSSPSQYCAHADEPLHKPIRARGVLESSGVMPLMLMMICGMR